MDGPHEQSQGAVPVYLDWWVDGQPPEYVEPVGRWTGPLLMDGSFAARSRADGKRRKGSRKRRRRYMREYNARRRRGLSVAEMLALPVTKGVDDERKGMDW